MTSEHEARIRFLLRVVSREAAHLKQTDGRLFNKTLNLETVTLLDQQPELAERVEAFVSRFSRLQDSLGDKLLPALLKLAGEAPRTTIENLDRAEKLGWVDSVDDWLALRKLRNQMVHEYIEDLVVLTDALNRGHASVGILLKVAQTLSSETTRLLER